jgi:hypothetical protein
MARRAPPPRQAPPPDDLRRPRSEPRPRRLWIVRRRRGRLVDAGHPRRSRGRDARRDPTAGEIPILTGLAAAGAGAGAIGTLIIVLPAISVPSMVMVAGAMGSRVTTALAAGVCVTGLLGGVLLTVLAA